MKSTPITEYNLQGLNNISDHLEFSDWEAEPVVKQITFSNFAELRNAVFTIFDAIETIGFNGDKIDLGTCGALAQLGKKLLPTDEMYFLDSLLIKDPNLKENFTKITTVK